MNDESVSASTSSEMDLDPLSLAGLELGRLMIEENRSRVRDEHTLAPDTVLIGGIRLGVFNGEYKVLAEVDEKWVVVFEGSIHSLLSGEQICHASAVSILSASPIALSNEEINEMVFNSPQN